MQLSIASEGLRLSGHLALPAPLPSRLPAVVLCHAIPRGPRGAATSAATYPDLADRIARDAGWAALAFNFRGTGASDGDFSVSGWRADVQAAVASLCDRDDVDGVWLAGVGEGGTLALCAAASDTRVQGVATLAAPGSLREWARDPGRLLTHARRAGMVRHPAFPPDLQAWRREPATVDAVADAPRLAPRPVLVVHGTADEVVPVSEARRIGDAVGATAELRLVDGGGHRLRHDPRAIAVLLGWLDRQAV